MRLVVLSFFLLISTGLFAQKPQLIKLAELQQLLKEKTDKVHVVNFWATWCAPCVKELPLFERLNAENSNVRVSLISMDLVLDPNPQKVFKFVEKKNLQSQVLLLDESEPNIDAIENKWSGALPATIIINGKTGERKFIERELKEGELESLITEMQ